MRVRDPHKRDLILRSAIDVIAEQGYFNTTVSQIAKGASIADGTIYLYFKTKDDILWAIFDDMMERFINRGLAEIEKISDPMEKLSRIIQLHLDILGEDRNLAKVFQIELRHTAHFMFQLSKHKLSKYFSILKNAIIEGQDTGQFRNEINPLFATKFIFGAIDEMATNWVLSEKHYRLENSAKAVIDLVMRGISS